MDRGTLLRLREMLELAIEIGTKEAYDGLMHFLAPMLTHSGDSHSEHPAGINELGQALTILNQVWYQGSVPLTNLPGNVDQQAEFSRLIDEISALQRFALTLSKGDLSSSVKATGLTIESLKDLQAALRHLTWQTRQIAEGDFNQRINFIDDFSVSFNAVSQGLAQARGQLKGVAEELAQINTNLKAEIAERTRIEAELKRYHELLENLSVTDGLTGIANRRRFDVFLMNEWRRATRYKTPLSIILMDIDFFKAYNDYYGHLAGDDCLRQVAKGLTDIVQRPGDLSARFGGEEFACVLPLTPAKGAMTVARQIVEKVHSLNISHNHSSVADRVTVSLGVATMVPVVGQQPLGLIQRADELLYEAKRSGRNQIRGWPEEKNGNFERID